MRQKFGYGHDNSSNHTYFILNPENWKDEEEELASHKLIQKNSWNNQVIQIMELPGFTDLMELPGDTHLM